MKKLLIFCVLFFAAAPAFALSYEKNADATNRTLQDYIKQYLDTPPGAIDWKTFGKTKEIDITGKDKNGYDLEYYKPGFPPEIKALDGKEITVKGYMFPLGEDENQTEFLFGPFPINCPFHYHVGPSLVIEVHSDKHPVKFSYDPVVVKGKLELVPKDEDNSTFFRLQDAELVKS